MDKRAQQESRLLEEFRRKQERWNQLKQKLLKLACQTPAMSPLLLEFEKPTSDPEWSRVRAAIFANFEIPKTNLSSQIEVWAEMNGLRYEAVQRTAGPERDGSVGLEMTMHR